MRLSLSSEVSIHPNVLHLLSLFNHKHLYREGSIKGDGGPAYVTARRWAILAWTTAEESHNVEGRGGQECSASLRKLVEGKDAAVRAVLLKTGVITGVPERPEGMPVYPEG